MAPKDAAKLYRQLLKTVDKHIGKEGKKVHFREFVIQEFRNKSAAKTSHDAVTQSNLRLARDYAFLLNSVHRHKELLFSYNIAVDRTDEMKVTIAKSAASVGLQLPEVYQP